MTRQPVLTDDSAGIKLIYGRWVRVAHDDDCDGLILDRWETLRRSSAEPGRRIIERQPQYRPCEACDPLKHALWAAGLVGHLTKAEQQRAEEIRRAFEPDRPVTPARSRPRRDRTGELIEE